MRPAHAVFAVLLGSAPLTMLSSDYAKMRATITTDMIIAGRLSERGARLAAAGDGERALSYYQRALRLDPKHSATHLRLAEHYHARRDWERAVIHCRLAIESNPSSSDAYNKLGALMAIAGNMDEAVKLFQTALKIAPYNDSARDNLVTAVAGRIGAR